MRPASALKPLAFGLALAGQGQAFPNLLSARQGGAGELVTALATLFQSILKVGDAFTTWNPEAWDYSKYGQMCAVYMETTDGGYCKAQVTCNDGVTNHYNDAGVDWNVCFIGGRQYFHDPRIGDFSITFTAGDSEEGQGLTKPVLQVAGVNNWQEFPVYELSVKTDNTENCWKGLGALNCYKGPYICKWWAMDNFGITASRNKRWNCGVPKIGESGGGVSNDGPENDRGYAPGWCGVHVTQYQKPNPATDSYALEVIIKDNNENEIGRTDGKAGPIVALASKLPWTLDIQTGAVDADPVTFQYAGDSWSAGAADTRCSLGRYDSGSRQMDCGFAC